MNRVSKNSRDARIKIASRQTLIQRQELLFPFADCIAKYFEVGLMQAMDVEGFIKLTTEARQLTGGPTDAHFMIFSRGLLEVVKYIREEDQVSFIQVSIICDDNLGSSWTLTCTVESLYYCESFNG